MSRETKTCACGVVFERPRGIRNSQWERQKSCSIPCSGIARRTHGLTGRPEFDVWRAMIARCHSPSDPHYPRWGGRGITVCDRWRESPAAFLEDMGPRPSPNHEIDRYPDNNGNYEKSNCRWATRKENGRNTRKNKMVTYQGETLTLVEWCERLGLPYHKIGSRLRGGWTVESAFETNIKQTAQQEATSAAA